MPKKQKVDLRRPGDFEEVDQELAEALALLDEANARVGQLLEGQDLPAETAGEAPAEEGATAPNQDEAGEDAGGRPTE